MCRMRLCMVGQRMPSPDKSLAHLKLLSEVLALNEKRRSNAAAHHFLAQAQAGFAIRTIIDRQPLLLSAFLKARGHTHEPPARWRNDGVEKAGMQHDLRADQPRDAKARR